MKTPRVVVVEDDDDLREALVRQFRGEGWEVYTAHNGREGVSRVLQARPDLIVLDLLMPEMTGGEMMAELIQHHSWVAPLPVLVLTNYTLGDAPAEAWTKQANVTYMIKSDWALTEVVAKVKSLLRPVLEEV